MSEHHLSADGVLLAELAAGTVIGHITHAFGVLPHWVGGACGALAVGVALRLLDPILKAHGERIRERYTIPPPPPVVVPRTRRVLVVDDDEACRVMIAAVLRDALPGVHVDEARSGAEARGLHARHHHGAIVADLVLGDELGADLLRAIGGRGDVLVSGVADADALDAAARACGAVAMRKPPAPDALAAAVTARFDAI